MTYTRLGDLLVGSGAITKEQLEAALRKQQENGKRLGAIQVEDGIIKLALDCPSHVDQIAADFREKFGDKVRMAVSGDTWLDIIPLEANKGLAVKELQESLNIRPEETIAFGDQLNDLEMLGRAYYSYAVGNAREEVKKAARFQADRNDRNGVLKVLKEILA